MQLFVIQLTSTNPKQIATTTRESKEQPNGPKVPDALNNSSIINLVKANLSDDLIIKVINSSRVNFNMSDDFINLLSNENVSYRVIQAMKTANGTQTSTVKNDSNNSYNPYSTGKIHVTQGRNSFANQHCSGRKIYFQYFRKPGAGARLIYLKRTILLHWFFNEIA